MCATDIVELRKLMVEKGIITISKLSEVSNVNRNTLSEVLNGDKQPSYTVMCKLKKALDLDGAKAGSIFFKEKLT